MAKGWTAAIRNPAETLKRAGDAFFSPTTMGLVASLFGEYVAEKALFTGFRRVFGDDDASTCGREAGEPWPQAISPALIGPQRLLRSIPKRNPTVAPWPVWRRAACSPTPT